MCVCARAPSVWCSTLYLTNLAKLLAALISDASKEQIPGQCTENMAGVTCTDTATVKYIRYVMCGRRADKLVLSASGLELLAEIGRAIS